MSKVVKKVGKGLKKVVKKVGKVVKKIAKPLAIAAAIYFTGGAALGAMGSSWGALGSSIASGASSLGSSLWTGAKAIGKGMLGMGGAGKTGMLGSAGGGFDPGGMSMGGMRAGATIGRSTGGSSFWGGLGNAAKGYLGGGSGGGGKPSFGSMALAGLDAYGSYRQGKEAQDNYRQAFATANPFAAHRPGFGNKLVNFMNDPNSITQTPGYKFAMEQGTRAMNRTSAAKGERVSGRALIEAQRFGGGLASQMRQQEINTLSNLSGANMGFGGGQYGAEAGNQYYGGLQQGLGTVGHAMGYGGNYNPNNPNVRY